MFIWHTPRWVRLAFVAGVATLALAVAGGTLAV